MADRLTLGLVRPWVSVVVIPQSPIKLEQLTGLAKPA
jgi:hypothetical protein